MFNLIHYIQKQSYMTEFEYLTTEFSYIIYLRFHCSPMGKKHAFQKQVIFITQKIYVSAL